jgi:hypothetical protein
MNRNFSVQEDHALCFVAERQNQILTELGKLKTWQTLFFVASYLDDPATSAIAAKSAMYIALPSVNTKAGMYGQM